MSQQWYDPSSKWLMEVHGASILYLAGARQVTSCRARKAEIVQPRQLPDGLLEARFAGVKQPRLFLVEVATYPEARVVEQICNDLRLVRLARGVLVDAVVLCLCPKGAYHVPETAEETSALGWSSETLRWKVVEVWTLSADDLLAAPNLALAVLATLAKYDGPPELLLQRCRDKIDREGGEQRADLLAAAQVFAQLHFDKPEWLDILGGSKAMIESPLIQNIVRESERTGQVKLIAGTLSDKFGPVGPTIEAGLALLKEDTVLRRLIVRAVTCASLQAFEEALREELPKPPPASTRGKKRKKSE